MKAAIEAETDMVDVSYMSEAPATLDEEAVQKNVTIIPDCGVAPGLSNILVGYSKTQLDQVNEVKIMVGGIPDTPVPPLGYTITWSVEGLIDEYVRPVKIVKNGRINEVPPLTGLEEVEFPGLGKLEAFYTDGLRTLIDTIPSVELMWEKTLRYPGHVSKINLLKDLGFFSEEPIEINGNPVTPREISSTLLGKKLWMPEVNDLLVMRIEVIGFLNGERICLTHQLMDSFDEEKNVSAMGRTTAYTASTVSGLLIKGLIKRKGVFPPELLGANNELSQIFFKDLKEKGITIESRKIKSE
jgi:saccharopine dehydrogenase-like NADP-dependent oxidoreductase